METMGKKKPRPRGSFTPEFKAEIVQRCQAGDRTVAQVARDFDLGETAGMAETGRAGWRGAQRWADCAPTAVSLGWGRVRFVRASAFMGFTGLIPYDAQSRAVLTLYSPR